MAKKKKDEKDLWEMFAAAWANASELTEFLNENKLIEDMRRVKVQIQDAEINLRNRIKDGDSRIIIRRAKSSLRAAEREAVKLAKRLNKLVVIKARGKLVDLCSTFEVLQKAVMDSDYTL